jgi:hypothetical protein
MLIQACKNLPTTYSRYSDANNGVRMEHFKELAALYEGMDGTRRRQILSLARKWAPRWPNKKRPHLSLVPPGTRQNARQDVVNQVVEHQLIILTTKPVRG